MEGHCWVVMLAMGAEQDQFGVETVDLEIEWKSIGIKSGRVRRWWYRIVRNVYS